MGERLRPEEFVPFAPDVPGTVHINHCKPGPKNQALYITRKEADDSIMAYCHHCGASGYHSVLGARALKTSESRKLADSEIRTGLGEPGGTGTGISGPGRTDADATKERAINFQPGTTPGVGYYTNPRLWPKDVQKWWLEYGLTYEQATHVHASYIPDEHSLEYSFLGGKQIRQFSREPKYLTYPRPEMASRDIQASPYSVSTLVLVEDFRSALKVSNYVDCLAMGGVHPTDVLLTEIVTGPYTKFIVWLDNDNQAVIAAARSLEKRLAALGQNVVRVPPSTVTMDPKEVPFFTIQRYLDEMNVLLNQV